MNMAYAALRGPVGLGAISSSGARVSATPKESVEPSFRKALEDERGRTVPSAPQAGQAVASQMPSVPTGEGAGRDASLQGAGEAAVAPRTQGRRTTSSNGDESDQSDALLPLPAVDPDPTAPAWVPFMGLVPVAVQELSSDGGGAGQTGWTATEVDRTAVAAGGKVLPDGTDIFAEPPAATTPAREGVQDASRRAWLPPDGQQETDAAGLVVGLQTAQLGVDGDDNGARGLPLANRMLALGDVPTSGAGKALVSGDHLGLPISPVDADGDVSTVGSTEVMSEPDDARGTPGASAGGETRTPAFAGLVPLSGGEARLDGSMPAVASVPNTPPPPLLPPLASSQWGRELGNHLAFATEVGRNGLVLKVNPPQLGEIEVRIHVAGGVVHAQFVSPHQAVRAAIESAMPQLQEAFVGSGLTLGQTSVDAGRGGHAGGAHAQSQSGGAGPIAALGSMVSAGSDFDAPGASPRLAVQRLVNLFA